MSLEIVRFESTPNPNAIKCVLNERLSDAPRSFLDARMAQDDPLAARLFGEAGITNLYINGDWMTISKPAHASWSTIKPKVERILAEV